MSEVIHALSCELSLPLTGEQALILGVAVGNRISQLEDGGPICRDLADKLRIIADRLVSVHVAAIAAAMKGE